VILVNKIIDEVRHLIPCDILKLYVKSFAVQETDNESTYKVLPDTSLIMGFQFKGKLSLLENQKEVRLASAGVSGIADRYRTFKNSAGIGTVLVFFKEAGAARFFKHPVHELFRERLSLENFMQRSKFILLEEQLCEAKTDMTRIKVIESFLISQMIMSEPDEMVFAALELIHKSKGIINGAENSPVLFYYT
jgi:hypothetical protein